MELFPARRQSTVPVARGATENSGVRLLDGGRLGYDPRDGELGKPTSPQQASHARAANVNVWHYPRLSGRVRPGLVELVCGSTPSRHRVAIGWNRPEFQGREVQWRVVPGLFRFNGSGSSRLTGKQCGVPPHVLGAFR